MLTLPPAPVVEAPGDVPPVQPSQAAEASSVPSVDIWGLRLAQLTRTEAIHAVQRLVEQGRPSYFITANVHYAMLSHQDPRLRAVNARAAFLLADGMPLVWYSRVVGRALPERVTGADLIGHLCGLAADRAYRVFLLGGAPGVAQRAAENLLRRFPGLQIVGTEAPDLDAMTAQEHQRLIARVRQAKPHLLFAALGQPKGELWLYENCEALGVPACVQVGASLDFVAGRLRRAPLWMQRTGLEWLYRLIHEPGRLLPRYRANAVFLVKAVLGDMLEAWHPAAPPTPERDVPCLQASKDPIYGCQSGESGSGDRRGQASGG